MSGKRDWRKAKLAGKRTLSELDDRESRERDSAARWLDRISKWKPARQRPRKAGAV
jgi:hypothetical protein